jgi:hypothetical protein
MYHTGTILKLREPQSTDEKPYAYDRVKVVGQSPVQHVSDSGSLWAGADATGIIIQPLTEYAPTIDKPAGQLEELYYVESYPLDPITQEPLTPENTSPYAPTPEQVLRKAAQDDPEAPRRPKAGVDVQNDALSPEQALRTA